MDLLHEVERERDEQNKLLFLNCIACLSYGVFSFFSFFLIDSCWDFISIGGESMLLFIAGMTIGILSATSSGKSEVDELNTQLKQMQSLVQDLHEELDMKETVVVKEMDDEEGDNAAVSIEEPCSSPSLVKASDKKAANLELLSRIEAELQAELEMLEQNLNVSDQDRISSFVEVKKNHSFFIM